MNLMELLKKYENLIINFINFIIKIIIKLKGIQLNGITSVSKTLVEGSIPSIPVNKNRLNSIKVNAFICKIINISLNLVSAQNLLKRDI